MRYQDITKLYKFKSIDKNLFKLIETNKIYAPSIDKLNDPFESIIYINKSDGRKLPKKYFADKFNTYINEKSLKHLNSLNGKSSLDSFAEYFYEYSLHNISFEENISKYLYQNFYKNIALRMGVISLTTDPNSLLLWSHYGDSHKGICIEFERNEDSKLNDDYYSFPVRYSSFIEDIKATSDNKEMIANFFKFKADCWSYEKEWRFITSSVNQEIELPGKISSIYFGLNTSENDIKEIITILGDSVKYYRADRVENKYEIGYSPYKP